MMPFEKPRILTESEIAAIRGKALVGDATPAELMLAFGHFDLVLNELRKLLGCFSSKIYISGAYGEMSEVDLKALLGD